MFLEMKRGIQQRRARDKLPGADATSTCGTDEGQVLVGFGPYSSMTREELFLSPDGKLEKYVENIMKLPVKYPGGRLHELQKYLTKKRAEQEAEDEVLVKITQEIEERHAGRVVSNEKIFVA